MDYEDNDHVIGDLKFDDFAIHHPSVDESKRVREMDYAYVQPRAVLRPLQAAYAPSMQPLAPNRDPRVADWNQLVARSPAVHPSGRPEEVGLAFLFPGMQAQDGEARQHLLKAQGVLELQQSLIQEQNPGIGFVPSMRQLPPVGDEQRTRFRTVGPALYPHDVVPEEDASELESDVEEVSVRAQKAGSPHTGAPLQATGSMKAMEPASLPLGDDLYGHRHSHPGVLISYGSPTLAPQAPLQLTLPGPSRVPQRSSKARPTEHSLRIQVQRTAAQQQDELRQAAVIQQTHQLQAQPQNVQSQQHSHSQNIQPFQPQQQQQQQPSSSFSAQTIHDAYDFVTTFNLYFQHNFSALATFEALCCQFNKGQINATQFYVSVYGILYQNKSMQLLPGFQKLMPRGWRKGELEWLHRAVDVQQDAKCKVKLEQVRAVSGKEAETLGMANIADAKNMPADQELEKKLLHGVHTKTAEDMALEIHRHGEQPGDRTEEKAVVPPRGEIEVTPKSKKKVPAKGFRTGSATAHAEELDVVPASERESENPRAMPKGGEKDANPLKTLDQTVGEDLLAGPLGSSSPLSDLCTSPANASSPPITSATVQRKATPAKRKAVEISPPSTIGAPTVKKGKLYVSSLSAAEVNHVGPVYPTRRAVLGRPDKPYIHLRCGLGFSHPQDTKHHASVCASGQGSNADDWDEHESCRVGYPDITYTRVKEGYVILDQGSWEKVKRATEAGQRFLREKDRQVSNGTVANAAGEEGGRVQIMEVTEGSAAFAALEPSRRKRKPVEAPREKKKQAVQPRKVVQGGVDEDSDKAAARAAALGLRSRT